MEYDIKVTSIKDTWKAPDGGVTIYTIVTEDAKELKTMSKQIASIGWTGTVKQYTNAKGNTYIRQPQKEGYAPTERQVLEAQARHQQPSNEQLDRIEAKIDQLLGKEVEERGDDSGKDEVVQDHHEAPEDDNDLSQIPF